ncbi:uncharacterized protein BHQ10_008167 [Talaromyces amestolkiae]|uniref:RING-type E3 ubiquitin transferase n=1 Tax=Talaromyces amestolkiae TaxID=1196081 RepID=A0A364L8L5_TALAM|nr:uncharacterized protein BHQ10_008167 [Talaromyces amestolkiae]RAO72155.1 hypothetical protein BHQ10_008167 [Talaromyces amestolkiae]
MADDATVRQEILNKTLQEIALEDEDGTSPCVICLDAVSEAAIAIPCKHDNFDFLCLASWLQQRRVCPLCKTELTAIKYDLQSPQGPKLYALPPPQDRVAVAETHAPRGPHLNRQRSRRRPFQHRAPYTPDTEDALARRRHVYRNQLFSLRVGSNRLSQYRELTPQLFNRDENLVSRARKWIRRELQVFEFLNPDDTEAEEQSGGRPRPGEQRLQNRRANNAEFLLEYVIAILRTVDIKGSAGQAEELLQEFIGRSNARLFLHELNSWLRSQFLWRMPLMADLYLAR